MEEQKGDCEIIIDCVSQMIDEMEGKTKDESGIIFAKAMIELKDKVSIGQGATLEMVAMLMKRREF